MTPKPKLEPWLQEYLPSMLPPEPPLLARLREETAPHPRAEMQISREQGDILALLVQAIGARKTLEIGVFTGYSSLVTALALPPDGRIIACDISEEFTSVARRYWQEAGVAHKIDLRLGPAAETLAKLLDEGHANTFDFAFIDADKPGYPQYYEYALQLVRPNGLIAIDNVFQRGRVADPAQQDENAVIIRELNAKLAADDRVRLAVLPFGDGMTLAVRR